MKNHTQTIINVCLAVSVTLLMYQNSQQKDQIETANMFAQHSVDRSWHRMDRMEAETTMIKERVGIEALPESKFGGEPVYYSVNERLTSYGLKVLENESRLDEATNKINDTIDTVNRIQKYLAE